MMKRVSLRRSALLWMTLLLTATGAITALVSYRYAYSEAAAFLDGQLRQIALNAGDEDGLASLLPTADQDPEDRFAVTVWGPDGRIIHASLPGVTIPRQNQPGYADVSAGGESWRVYTMMGDGNTVQAAQRQTVREEIADSAALGGALPVLLIIPLSWLVVGWAMNRVLRRLDALAGSLAARSATAAGAIPLTGIPVEVAPLVESMNDLIVRLHTALDAQKRLLADAAHELRTPLAAIQIEVDNLAAGTANAPEQRVAALANTVRRAGALVNQLLRMVDLEALLLECCGDSAVLAHSKGLDLGVYINAQKACRAEAGELRVLFTNLLDNALRYTPAGGKVDVSLYQREDKVIVDILDTGTGLSADATAHIFERFYRAAPAGTEGSGLGLAIARRIAERHGFSLTVDNRTDGVTGVLARVSIPAPEPCVPAARS
jgi:two-component system OmpR family sensor kinase